MRIGQKVSWKSHGTKKTGRIVAILKCGQRPVDYVRAHLPHHRLLFDGNCLVRKNEKVVLVEMIFNNRKPAVYKPRVSALEFDDY